MATGNIGKKLQSEITCLVCLEYLVQPVTLDCGHNFCHACIVKYWGQIPDQTACPQCRVAVPRWKFKPNGQLATVVQLIRQLSDQVKQMTRTSKTCQGHEPAMLVFCRDDLVPICLLCDGSQEHQTHDVIPVAQAAEEYKNVGGVLERYTKKKKFENPVSFPPEIKHEIWELQDFSAFLPGAVKQFEDCIMKCWKESSSELACPQCKHIGQNKPLENVVGLLKQLRAQAEGDTKCCQKHQERLELFCKNDQVFVCSVCRGSEEHRDHTVIPIETAGLEFK
ncbi:PREDICTED: tripartite motif-containing protein 12A-like, partial [Thamnophis sirtalis]|uniref:Tripartite motif-containing protein 12A-like n=1 Tax=Thamnophis sirtalis TaxID=35019 RepID=A0A6I9Y901_9SAUR